jgi:hypothetical protein
MGNDIRIFSVPGWLPAALLLASTASCGQVGPAETFRTELPGDVKQPSDAAAPQSLGMPAIAPTPRNFPRHKPEDVQAMFDVAAGISQATVHIYQWSDPNLPTLPGRMAELARRRGLEPILGLSPTTLDQGRKELDLPRSLRGGRPSFADGPIKAAFIRTAEDLARLKPRYLCLATEINLLGLQRIEEYVRFAALYKEAYHAVKKISPNTKVFVSFQYEFVRILDNKDPGKIADHSKLFEIFRPEIDIIAITTYPSGFYETPLEMPANYYAHLRKYLKPGEEVMVMEAGWPSGGKGTPSEQRQFIRRLPSLLADLSSGVTAWSLLHDVDLGAFGVDLSTTGLLSAEGGPKPALEEWKNLAKRARPPKPPG